MPKGVSRAEENRRIRQEALREQLQASEYLRQINDAVQEVIESRYSIDPNELNARKFVVETNLKRLNKVLPDLKSVEHDAGEGMQYIFNMAFGSAKGD